MRSQLQHAPARRGIGRLEVIVAVVVAIIIASVAIALLLQQQAGGEGLPGADTRLDGDAAKNVSPEDLHKKHRANYQAARNNMKRISLGCQDHDAMYRTYPALYFSNDPKLNDKMNVTQAKGTYPWTVRILPFIEEDALYKNISARSNRFTESSEVIKIEYQGQQVSPREIDLPQFHSPHLGDRKVRGNNNYVALPATRLPLLLPAEPSASSSTPEVPGPDGMIIPTLGGRGQSLRHMSDGTSKTVILCESRELEKSNWYEPTQCFVVGFVPENSTPKGNNFYPFLENGKWIINPQMGNPTALDYGPTAADPKRAYYAKDGDPLARTWGPSGGHPIGTMVLHAMGDGSVRAISNDIDPQVYFKLITCRGGEFVPMPDEAQIQ